MGNLTVRTGVPVVGMRNFDHMIKDWLGVSPFEGLVSREEFLPVSFPRVDVKEDKDSIVIVAEIPGMRKDDIKVVVEDNILTIAGERKYEHEEKSEGVLRREITRGAFTRSFTLPDSVASDKLDASYRDGFLTLSIPKREETKPKQIEVKVK